MVTHPTGWIIEFYTDEQGVGPVLEFINKLPNNEQVKVRHHLRLLQLEGIGLRMPAAKSMPGHRPLWELRPGSIRLLYFLHTNHRFIILHAFRKKSQKTPKKEIATAERRMHEFLESEQ